MVHASCATRIKTSKMMTRLIWQVLRYSHVVGRLHNLSLRWLSRQLFKSSWNISSKMILLRSIERISTRVPTVIPSSFRHSTSCQGQPSNVVSPCICKLFFGDCVEVRGAPGIFPKTLHDRHKQMQSKCMQMSSLCLPTNLWSGGPPFYTVTMFCSVQLQCDQAAYQFLDGNNHWCVRQYQRHQLIWTGSKLRMKLFKHPVFI